MDERLKRERWMNRLNPCTWLEQRERKKLKQENHEQNEYRKTHNFYNNILQIEIT